MIALIKRILANRDKRDRLIIQHDNELKAYGQLIESQGAAFAGLSALVAMRDPQTQILLAESFLALASMQMETLELIRGMGKRVAQLEPKGQHEEFDRLLGVGIRKGQFHLDQFAAGLARMKRPELPTPGDGGAQ